MKITVFTSNQPRHIALIESLASIADEVFAVQECTTVFPGEVEDFYHRTPVMQDYFQRVMAAEKEVFGRPRFSSQNARQLVLKSGDLNRLEMAALEPGLHSDAYVVFGASFIKGALCDFLVAQKAVNIHMGTSPYYRGNSCNFWAAFDGRTDYVGATIHFLTKGLDSGPMLFHTLPQPVAVDPFVLGMVAVKAAHVGLTTALQNGTIWKMTPTLQDESLEFRYTRNRDFTDEVVSQFLQKLPSSKKVLATLKKRDGTKFLRPFLYTYKG